VTRNVSVTVGVVATLILSLLAASVGPVGAANVSTSAAADELVVGSSHSTASDFENANQLDNLSISGSGDDASVTLESSADTAYTNDNTIYFQEGDGTITNTGVSGGVGDVGDFDGDGTMEAVYTSDNNELGLIEPSGDTTILATDAIVAGYVGDVDADGNDEATFRDSDNQFAFVDLDGSDRVNTTQDVYGVGGVGDFDDDGVIETALRDTGSNIVLREPDGTTTDTGVDAYRVGGGGDIDADGAPEIAIITSNDNEAAFVQADNSLTRTSVIDVTKIGGIGDLDGDGTKELMGLISGDVTTITASGSTTTLDSVETYDGVGGIGIVSPSVAEYESQPHVIDDGEAAAVNLTLSDVAATVEVTDSSGTVVVSETLSTTGNHTVQFGQTVDDPTVAISFDVTGDSPAATIHDESILFTNHAPSASNLEPADGTETTQQTVNFSVAISDAEFPTAQGDSVTAELFVDNTSLGTKTVTQNTTVSIQEEMTDGGAHEYYWELSDSYGATTTTEAKTFTVPNTLYIYTEETPHELLNGTDVSVEVTATGSDGATKSVTVSDGKVDMSGLPSDQSYVFTLETENYHTREIYVRSIYDQPVVFMLNKSYSSVENKLTVADRTGQFEQPIITVERVINTSNVAHLPDNGDEWVTVGGDRLGASGFYIIDLKKSARYRFVVINRQGDERVLGEYTAKASGEVPLGIGSIEYTLGADGMSYKWATYATNESDTSPALTFAYNDPADETENLSVAFKYRSNGTVIASKDFDSGPYGEVVFTQPVNESVYNNNEFVVEWSASRDGSVLSGKRPISGKRDISPPLAGVWMQIGYGGVVFLLAFATGAGIGAGAAMVTVSVFAGLAVFLGLAPPALGFGAAILGLLLSVAAIMFGGRPGV
jgi:hypothetical protein